jgi:hypothetical protein
MRLIIHNAIYKNCGIVLLLQDFTINRNLTESITRTLISKDILVSRNSVKLYTDLAGEMINKAIVAISERKKEIED